MCAAPSPGLRLPSGAEGKFKAALETVSLNLTQVKALTGVDVVHTHTWYASLAGFLAKKLYEVPFVLTTHSLEPLRAWKAEQLGTGYAMSSWIERTAILDADAVIAVSKGTRDDILRAYPVAPERVHVIYNGIDVAEYRYTPETAALKATASTPARPTSCSWAGSRRQKGVTHLVDAIGHLPPDTQVVLCAGAPDTPEIAAEMRKKVDEARRNNPRVIWIEKTVARSEVIQLYSHARVFCCPSVYEPFGIINLEAMACGAPVVASRTGGIPEVVVDGETGFLVSFDQDPVTGFPVEPGQICAGSRCQASRAARRRAEMQALWRSGPPACRGKIQLDQNRRRDDPTVRKPGLEEMALKQTIVRTETRPTPAPTLPVEGRKRVIVEGITPQVDGGRFPAKRTVGDIVRVEADIFTDGHDSISAMVLYRHEDLHGWQESPMQVLVNDRWAGEFTVQQLGRYRFTIHAWVDHWETWRHDLAKRIDANSDAPLDYLIGANLIEEAAARAAGEDAEWLRKQAHALRIEQPVESRRSVAIDPLSMTSSAAIPTGVSRARRSANS